MQVENRVGSGVLEALEALALGSIPLPDCTNIIGTSECCMNSQSEAMKFHAQVSRREHALSMFRTIDKKSLHCI